MNSYDIGDTVRTTGTFTNPAGDPTNTTASVRIRKPDGSLTTVSPTNDSAGVYHYDIVPDQHGEWRYRYVGVGQVVSQEENAFYVREQKA